MDAALEERLGEIQAVHEETLQQLADPDVLADQDRYTEIARRHAELKPVVDAYQAYLEAATERDDALELAGLEDDDEMAAYLRRVAEEKGAEIEKLELELRRLLVPRDPNDQKDVIMEVRSAAGGEEAALWAGDLYRMYQRYAERHGWTVETESSGRVHTSIATVAVLPEVEDVEVELSDADLEIDVFRARGPGGQSVNTTDSAVRITHKPTGLVVSCQDEKSQLQNKLKAMRVLRARLYQQQLDEQLGEIAAHRKAQVGTGERAEKIRTYNFRENRVTDHRVGLTIKRLPDVLEGDLDEFHEALMADDEARRLTEGEA